MVGILSNMVSTRDDPARTRPEHDPEKWVPVFRKDHMPELAPATIP
jgi:hypothetical protein